MGQTHGKTPDPNRPSLEVIYTLTLLNDVVFWDVRYRTDTMNNWRTEAVDSCRVPTGKGGETPWGDVAVCSVVERWWEACFAVQLELPFP
jgi:hypothetical protein